MPRPTPSVRSRRRIAPPRLFLLVLPAVLLLPVSGAARQETGTPEASAPAHRPARYVLHLEGGGLLRAEARSLDGSTWQVRQGRDWVDLAGSRVLRAVDEVDLLARARRLRREAWKEGGLSRVAYADWLVSEGLLAEALEALDDVLEEEPELEPAVALAARLPVRLPVPDPTADLPGWLREASRLGPAARELALAPLVGAAEVPGLHEALASELVHQDPRRRSFATHVLRRVLPGLEVQPLLVRAVLDSSARVRDGAVLALRATGEPAVVVPVVRALGSESPAVRANAIDALSGLGFHAAVAPLYTHLVNLQSGGGRTPHANVSIVRQLAYVQDFDVEVAQGAAIADPVVNVLDEGSVLDAASLGVTEYRVAEESARVRRALEHLTGASPGKTTSAWTRWWEEHGPEWTAEPPAPPTSPRGSGR